MMEKKVFRKVFILFNIFIFGVLPHSRRASLLQRCCFFCFEKICYRIFSILPAAEPQKKRRLMQQLVDFAEDRSELKSLVS